MNENLFAPILDKDEEIIKTYKPHRSRAYVGTIIADVFFSIWIVFWFVGCLVDGEAPNYVWIAPVVCEIILLSITFIFVALWYNKTVYAITNKRVLIRTGYIGVDYKSLNFDMLGAMTVNVNFIDKIVNKNTGSIAFGSMSSPLTNQGGAKFMFQYIRAPYDVYREVKEIIDQNKQK